MAISRYREEMEFNGLPLHPLVVHAVVVFAPLSAGLALGYAALARWRWALRWPLILSTLFTLVASFVAVLAGQDLAAAGDLGEAIQEHQERGELLRNVMVGFTLLVGLAAWRLGGPSALVSGKGARQEKGGALDLATVGVLALAALAVLGAAFLAGDSGSRSVWG